MATSCRSRSAVIYKKKNIREKLVDLLIILVHCLNLVRLLLFLSIELIEYFPFSNDSILIEDDHFLIKVAEQDERNES
jgi:hypothetical protein